jgi:hypothetical protein
MSAPTTDQEWAAYLSDSSDPDDQSLAARIRLLEELQAKGPPFTQRQAQFMEVANEINRRELAFLKRSSAYRISHDRPCWPRWHWWPLLFEDGVRDQPQPKDR